MKDAQLAALLTVAALILSACAGEEPASVDGPEQETGDSTGSDQGAADDIDAIQSEVEADPSELEGLVAPSGTEVFEADYSGEGATAPTSGEQMVLPYEHILPIDEGPIGDPDRTYTFCFSQALTGSTWAVAQADSAQIQAEKHPNVEVLFRNTDNDAFQQVEDLQTCQSQGVDGFVIWPHSVEPLTPEIESLHEAGEVVVGMERTVSTDEYSSWVYLDNRQATRDLAEWACDYLEGEGTIAELDGAVGSSPQILRQVLFIEAIEDLCPDVEVVFTAPTDYSRGQGYQVMLDFLQSGREFDLLYSQYTETGVGAHQALEDFGLVEDIPHISIVDGSVAVSNMVEEEMFAAISAWTPVHGDLGLRLAIHHVLGEEVPQNLLLAQPPLITQENAEQVLSETTWPG
jgi:galactofuranose transport system substrate-binding protein